MNRLEHAYTGLDLIKTIKNFESQLLEKKITQKSDMNNPSIIYSKLDDSLSDLKPSEFGIDKWISKDPFNRIMATEDLFQSSDFE